MHRKTFWAFLDTFIFFPIMTPPSTPTLCTKSWKFSKYFWTFKGKKLKSLKMSQESFLDDKTFIHYISNTQIQVWIKYLVFKYTYTFINTNTSRLQKWEQCFKIQVIQMFWDYLELVYLVTALVPSETACLASSPGRRSLTAVWISREVMVDLLSSSLAWHWP